MKQCHEERVTIKVRTYVMVATVVATKCHTHTRTSQHQFLISRTPFLHRTMLQHTLTFQHQPHVMAHTHHFQCCWTKIDLTWTVLHPQQPKQRPFLLSAYRQFIRRQEQSYAQTHNEVYELHRMTSKHYVNNLI